MADLLITIPSSFPIGFGLGLFNWDSRVFRWADVSALPERIVGVYGACRVDDQYWCAGLGAESEGCILMRLDENLNCLSYDQLPDVRDPHSLIPYDDGLLLVDTRNNCVLKISRNDGEVTTEMVWQEE